MSKAIVFFADGFEEIEAITTVDFLRRASVETLTVSIMSGKTVTGAHSVPIICDETFDNIAIDSDVDSDVDNYDALILPGGMPGTTNLKNHEGTARAIRSFFEKGKLVAAICAAPTVFGELGILEGKQATCFPAMQGELKCGEVSKDKVVVAGNVITSVAAGTTAQFAAKIIELLESKETADKVFNSMYY